MKKMLFSLIFLFLCISCLQAQILTGKVVDSKTLAPLSEVSVYLNGTSINTTTDDDGMFTLSMNRVISTDLVVTRVGYATAYISNPFHQSLDTILLVEKENELDEISVFPDKMRRNKKLKMFKHSFFGKTKGGKSCVIRNEEVLDLYFNTQTNMLTVEADAPLVIENKHLGYIIYFNLLDFQAIFTGDPLLLIERESFILGTTLFEDIKPNQNKYTKRREETYVASRTYFLKNFVNNTLVDAGYTVEIPKSMRVVDELLDINEHFDIKDSNSIKRMKFRSETGFPPVVNDRVRFTIENASPDNAKEKDQNESESVAGDKTPDTYGYIRVIDSKKNRSTVEFYSRSFWIDTYGNIVPMDESGNTDASFKLSFSGFLGSRLMGDILPMDYEP